MRDDLKRRGGITYERVAKNRKMKDKKMPFTTRLFDGQDYGSRILAELSFSFLVAETPTTVSDRQNRPRRFPKREMWKNECKLNEFQIVCRKDCAQSSSVCFNICAMDAWRSRSSSEEEFNSKEKHNKQILICETRKKLNCLSYCSKYNHNSRSKLAQGNDT